MKFDTRLLIALDSGCVIAYVPESLKPVLLDPNFQPYKGETFQSEYVEFLELVMRRKIDLVDQAEPDHLISHKGAEFYRKHPRTPSLVATLS